MRGITEAKLGLAQAEEALFRQVRSPIRITSNPNLNTNSNRNPNPNPNPNRTQTLQYSHRHTQPGRRDLRTNTRLTVPPWDFSGLKPDIDIMRMKEAEIVSRYRMEDAWEAERQALRAEIEALRDLVSKSEEQRVETSR
eukprot:1157782-Amorphochlora_amoeboformis.AAC.1